MYLIVNIRFTYMTIGAGGGLPGGVGEELLVAYEYLNGFKSIKVG
jgi:hypothetical protein